MFRTDAIRTSRLISIPALIGSALLLSSTSFAGNATSGGGGVHACYPGGAKAPSTVEFYDLYEGREVNGTYSPVNLGPQASTADYLNFALNKIYERNPGLYHLIRGALAKMKQIQRLQTNKALTRINDADILMTDKECRYEQLANWNDRFGALFVDQEFYSKLSPLSVAAFDLHESVYSLLRKKGVYNSNDVRTFVANVFSTKPIELNLKDFEKLRDYPQVEVYGSGLRGVDFSKPFHVRLRNLAWAPVYVSRVAFRGYKADGERGYGPDGDVGGEGWFVDGSYNDFYTEFSRVAPFIKAQLASEKLIDFAGEARMKIWEAGGKEPLHDGGAAPFKLDRNSARFFYFMDGCTTLQIVDCSTVADYYHFFLAFAAQDTDDLDRIEIALLQDGAPVTVATVSQLIKAGVSVERYAGNKLMQVSSRFRKGVRILNMGVIKSNPLEPYQPLIASDLP